MERALIEQRLLSYANWYAASHGYTFGKGADSDIKNMTREAVMEMFGKKIPKKMQPQHHAKILRAEASLAMLIATMIQGSKEISGYTLSNPNVLGEHTFKWASERLCPLFPIC